MNDQAAIDIINGIEDAVEAGKSPSCSQRETAQIHILGYVAVSATDIAKQLTKLTALLEEVIEKK